MELALSVSAAISISLAHAHIHAHAHADVYALNTFSGPQLAVKLTQRNLRNSSAFLDLVLPQQSQTIHSPGGQCAPELVAVHSEGSEGAVRRGKGVNGLV